MVGLKNSLQIRTSQTQTLAMTPQLQQAIRLLQLSTLELSQEIRDAVDSNPLLEIEEDSENPNVESLDILREHTAAAEDGDFTHNPFDNDSSIKDNDIVVPPEQPLNLSENSSQEPGTTKANDNFSAGVRQKQSFSAGDGSVYEGEVQESLKDHLLWQLNMSPLEGADKLIAENIIDSIDDSGYLQESIEDICATVSKTYPDTDCEGVLAVLKLIQKYDPPSVGSRNVQECLMLQLEALDPNTPYLSMSKTVVRDYLNLLSAHDYRSLCQKMSIREDVLRHIISLITSLNPRPGHIASNEKSDFIIPDVMVVKDSDGHYTAVLNNNSLPRARINEHYRHLADSASNERDKEFFKSHLQEANWFLQSIEKRNNTLLKVANCIVEHQQEFMEQGESAMHPMILNDIATEIEMHESTISRITTQKYILTPRGTFELKYFFSSSVNTDEGGAASSKAIRAKIKELIAAENPRKPLSDSKISEELQKNGLLVARRTVAKYRESMGILSSSQRKSLF